MRVLVCLALLMPGGALADTIMATSRVTAVTIYPQGAQVTREAVFTAPAGGHEVVIVDLPGETEPGLLRVASDDVDLGAFALRSDRLPPRGDATSPDMVAAEDAVKAAKAALLQTEARVSEINAEVEAQEAQIAFLTGVKLNDGAATAEGISTVSQMIGTRVLAARLAALAARTGLPAAEEAVTMAAQDLSDAEAALAALSQRAEDYAALAVSVTAKGGEGHLVVTHFVYDANWSPVYDMALDRKAGKLIVDRGVLVRQASGEDWAGIALTLSTARPSEQSEPSQLFPWLRRVEDPLPDADTLRMSGGVAEAMMEPEPVVVAAVESATMSYQGDTVIYDYPTAVNVASGVEDLRLALDKLSFATSVVAQAVPRQDATAFVVASLTNDSAEILLPGTAYLYRDGALTGMTELQVLSPGGKADLGFGAIDGIRLTRDMPQRTEGDRGIIATSTQIEETAVLEVENLTGEAWPVRVLDLVPYSEQEELEISYSADPAITEADVDGKRGVLAWDFDLAVGEKKAITLTSVISWPEGKVLQ